MATKKSKDLSPKKTRAPGHRRSARSKPTAAGQQVNSRGFAMRFEGEEMVMRRHILIVSALASLFVLHAVPARAQTTAAGPYYATPAWDQKLQCDTLTTCPRFVVLSNWNSEAVLDRETGLVWEKSPTGSDGWLGAQFTCNNRAVGNRKGWRLPTIQELTSLIDPSVAFPGPTLPAGHPFLGVESPTTFYWSATTWAADASLALYVRLVDGVVDASVKSNSRVGWCVRGGQGPDAQ